MSSDERATNSNGMSRRNFMKAGGAVLGGAAITGLSLETGALEALAADGGRALREGHAAGVGMSQARLDDVAARVQNRIDRGLMPGAVVLVARHGQVVLHQAMGAKESGKEAMTKDTLFDLESNTKVLATAISYMVLVERRVVSLSDPIAKFLPHFATNGKEHITLRDMLRYSSGLPIDINLPGAPNLADVPGPSALWTLMEETPLEYPTGTKVEYSDLTYRLLGHTFEAITGQNLQQFAKANVWSKLGMTRTTYNPLANGFTVSDTAATGAGLMEPTHRDHPRCRGGRLRLGDGRHRRLRRALLDRTRHRRFPADDPQRRLVRRREDRQPFNCPHDDRRPDAAGERDG